jgi:thiol-disulfide isomerase/thioredoxin
MTNPLLDPPMVRMPALAGETWLNGPPLTAADLHGRVVLVDFWDYSCVNCVRTLPYLKAWHERYAALGLTIVGVHAPEFRFAQDPGQLEAALAEFGLPYPILLDNRFDTWHRFANKAWPTKHLIDHRGYVRYRHQGEGRYRETEQAIQALLKQRNPDVTLPPPMPALRPEDAPGAVCYRATPELHAGYTAGLFGGALGNPRGYELNAPVMYELPESAARRPGAFYVEGFWQAHAEFLRFAGQEGGWVAVPYEGAGANAVLSPTGDEVALRLGLLPDEERRVLVKQDNRWLTPANAGADIRYDEDNLSYVSVARPRLYELVRNDDFGHHELQLVVQASGIALYSFTFTSCVRPGRGG